MEGPEVSLEEQEAFQDACRYKTLMTDEHIKTKIINKLNFIFEESFNLENRVHQLAMKIKKSSQDAHNEIANKKLT